MKLSYKQASTHTPESLAKDLSVDIGSGLSKRDAEKLLVLHGHNVLERHHAQWWLIFVRQFKSSFTYLLLAAAIISFILGENIDAILILIFVSINSVIGFFQEYRSERTVEMLSSYLISQVKVRRDGEEILVGAHDVVPGDIIFLAPGDIAPCDIRLASADLLNVNESILTGESVPVIKTFEIISEPASYSDAKNIVFGGTAVISGKGVGVVFATGRQSIMGAVATLSAEVETASAFEKGVQSISKFILQLVGATLALVFALKIGLNGLSQIGDVFIFSVALAVSVIPEGLPLVTTFTLSRGAHQLAKKKVIVKKLSSIEDLGSIDILCTDKTGTLTENKLSVSEVFSHDKLRTLCLGAVGCGKTVYDKNIHDPFDIALFQALTKSEIIQCAGWVCLDQIPFDPIRRRTTVLVKCDKICGLIERGAFEEIKKNCSHNHTKDMDEWVRAEGARGRRVLAIAFREVPDNCKFVSETDSGHSELIGCISFADPLKPTAISAVEKAKHLGVQVKILTGDSQEVAMAVGIEVGLLADQNAEVMTGQIFSELSELQKHEAAQRVAVFARVSPEQKYDIIRLLEETASVGFLGEGINDAPALKAASVGLVVSGASDVAREAADIILLHKSLRVIIDGIEEGRRVFVHITTYLKATLGSNFGNFYAVVFTSFFIPFLPLLPVQILLLNLLSDVPMMAIASDKVEHGELLHPRKHSIRDIVIISTILGIVSTAFDLMFFKLFFGYGASTLQTMWFIASILTELAFLFSIRTRGWIWKAKKVSLPIILLTGMAAMMTLFLPFTNTGHQVFGFISPPIVLLLEIFGLLILYVVCTEIVKHWYYLRVEKRII